ncbi:MAG: hypothetical protein K0R55_3590 [Sporomusa sp.]|nr:hypothetical protein [Sporomusa sp.]
MILYLQINTGIIFLLSNLSISNKFQRMINVNEKRTIKTIGLTAEELIRFAIYEHSNRLMDKEDEILGNKEITKLTTKKELENLINQETIIDTVAAMIEYNNRVLLEHLKKLGVLQD